ncbi:MAG: hypothetical protein KGZ39_06245 [Simkania sp.]|nr:hypothetical protein [Simkania sp.]
MSLQPKSLNDLITQLQGINQTIDEHPLVESHGVRTRGGRTFTLVASGRGSQLDKIGKEIQEVDRCFQQLASSGALLGRNQEQSKKDYEQQFDRALKGYERIIPPAKATPPILERTSREQALDDELLPRMHHKALRIKEDFDREWPNPRITGGEVWDSQSPRSPLHQFFCTWQSIAILDAAPRFDRFDSVAKVWRVIPYGQRRSICQQLGIDSFNAEAELQRLLDNERARDFAACLMYLSDEDIATLEARLKGLEGFEWLVNYIEAFKEKETLIVLALINDEGIFANVGDVVKSIAERVVQEKPLREEMSRRISEQDSKVQGPNPRALVECIDRAQSSTPCVFARMYNEVLAIMHGKESDETKKQILRKKIEGLSLTEQEALYQQIHRLHPDRADRLGWGQRHALDDLGIFLGAIYALCPANQATPFSSLISDLQKILHSKNRGQDQQGEIKKVLERAKKVLSDEHWRTLRAVFYHRFPSAKEQGWGFQGEEKQFPKYPHHLLLSLHAITHEYGCQEFWSSMKSQGIPLEEIQKLASKLPSEIAAPLLEVCQVQVGGRTHPSKQEKSSDEVLWCCYNTIESCKRQEILKTSLEEKVQDSAFFQRMWDLSPLCADLRSGQVIALDLTVIEEIQYRLKLLDQLQALWTGAAQRCELDQGILGTLIHRILLQPDVLVGEDREFAILSCALHEVATAEPAYDPQVAKEVLEMMANATSRRQLSGIKRARPSVLDDTIGVSEWTLKGVSELALALPMQGRPLDYTGPRQFKDLVFFKRDGAIIAKMKSLDPAIAKDGKYKVSHLYRESKSSEIDEGIGFHSTAPTTYMRVTLGEGILKLSREYSLSAECGDALFAHLHPLLSEAIKKRLPTWDTASAQEKSKALQLFYERTGATDLLQVVVEKLEQGKDIQEMLPMFHWLPVKVRYAVYGKQYEVKPPKAKVPFGYGQFCFENTQSYSSTNNEKIRAIKRCLTSTSGLQPSYPEEGLGSIQLWQADAREVTDLLSKEVTAAARLKEVPKERVDLYALSHLIKGHGDIHTGNILFKRGSKRYIDCDEEHCLPARNDYNQQIMWEMGLPTAEEPIRPLLMHFLRHPYIERTTAALMQYSRRHSLASFKGDLDKEFEAPRKAMTERVAKLKLTAERVTDIRGGIAMTTQDLFFSLFGGQEEHTRLKGSPQCRDKSAVIFEQYLGTTAPRVQPLRTQMALDGLPPSKPSSSSKHKPSKPPAPTKYETYWENIKQLSKPSSKK